MLLGKDPSQRIRYLELALLSGVLLVCVHSIYGLIGGDSSSASRSPASVESLGPATEAALQETMETVDLGCLKGDVNLGTAASRVRLKAMICDEKGKPLPTSMREPAAVAEDNMVENPATGYRTTVYMERSTGELTTEFIPLRLGENKVLLSLQHGKGGLRQHRVTVVQTK